MKILILGFLSVLTCSVLALYANGNETFEIDIKMVPGILIKGGNGTVSIEYTTNLNLTDNWILLEKIQVTNSQYFYIDGTATNTAKRFYRATKIVSASPTNPDPTKLVWIEPGTFTMGSPATEIDRESDEGPQTQVTISQGFWMSKYEVTQKEYQNVMGNNPSYFTGDLNWPVEQVSWYDATNYCGKLTQQERAAGRLPSGFIYRLPTEAEWEYACRAGTTTRFSYGDDLNYTSLGNYAWYGDNSWYSTKPNGKSFELDGKYYTTHPVGQKLPNPWGLYDMYGNVWEICSDWYSDNLPGGSMTDFRGPSTGSYRVERGCCFYKQAVYFRSANRSYFLSDEGGFNIGFRPVLAPGQ